MAQQTTAKTPDRDGHEAGTGASEPVVDSPTNQTTGAATVGVRTYVAPGRSALLHWKLVGIVTVLGLLAGIGYAFGTRPSYTSSATLFVGKTLSLGNTASIPGLSNAATTIAEDYARLISTSTVTSAAEKTLHSNALAGTLTASVIPNTPEILVTATAASASHAEALANAGSGALIASVASLNRYNTNQLKALASSYSNLEVNITNEDTQIGALQGLIRAQPSSPKAGSWRAHIQSLQTQVSAQTLQAQTVYGQYQNSFSPYPAEESVLQQQSPATVASSSRDKELEIGLVIGAVFALIVGVAVASLVDLRKDRRAAIAEPPTH